MLLILAKICKQLFFIILSKCQHIFQYSHKYIILNFQHRWRKRYLNVSYYFFTLSYLVSFQYSLALLSESFWFKNVLNVIIIYMCVCVSYTCTDLLCYRFLFYHISSWSSKIDNIFLFKLLWYIWLFTLDMSVSLSGLALRIISL